jgi:hypothetical protein
MTETLEQLMDIPPESLLSSTSGIPERHGELAYAISQLDLVTCEDLSNASAKAMRDHFIAEKTPVPVRMQVRKLAQGISMATSATLKYLQNEDEDEPDVDIDSIFPGLELRLCEESGKEVDQTIRSVLGKIGVAGYFDHGPDNRTYLFRIATGDPNYDMIAELHRSRIPEQQVPFLKHVDVMYHMSIAGYDVVDQ